MEESSPRECGLALMPASALLSVCPWPVLAPPGASVSTPVNKAGNRYTKAVVKKSPGLWRALREACCLSSPSILQAQPLCLHTSVPSALTEFSFNERIGFGVSQPGWDGAAPLRLQSSQTSARWMDGERDKGVGYSWLPTCWDWPSAHWLSGRSAESREQDLFPPL